MMIKRTDNEIGAKYSCFVKIRSNDIMIVSSAFFLSSFLCQHYWAYVKAFVNTFSFSPCGDKEN